MEIFYGMKRESDWKCVNHVRVHASAQSFDRCTCEPTKYYREIGECFIIQDYKIIFTCPYRTVILKFTIRY